MRNISILTVLRYGYSDLTRTSSLVAAASIQHIISLGARLIFSWTKHQILSVSKCLSSMASSSMQTRSGAARAAAAALRHPQCDQVTNLVIGFSLPRNTRILTISL